MLIDSGKVAIIGAAETDELGSAPNLSAIQHRNAARNAILDAVREGQIDGTPRPRLRSRSRTTRASPSYVDGTSLGGSHT
jgi:hypothetical protein